MRLLFIALALIASSACLYAADSTIVWRAEVRVRGEVDGRDFSNGTPAFGYALLRARLAAEFRPAADVSGLFQIQESRTFGNELPNAPANTLSISKNLDVHQGYLRINNLFLEDLSLKVGRMELSYGRERIVGTYDWDNIGRAFDAALLRYAQARSAFDVFVANVVETNVPPVPVTVLSVHQTPDEGFLFSGLVYDLTAIEDFRLGAYCFHEWDEKKSVPGRVDLSRFTLGASVQGTEGGWIYDGEAAFQTGRKSVKDVNALMISLSGGLLLGDRTPLTIKVGYDYLSGNHVGDPTYRSFDPTFHSGHDRFGAMDYFADPVSATSGLGLQNLFLLIDARPWTELSLAVKLHEFLLAEAWNGDQGVGQELDVRGCVKAWDHAAFEFGASLFVPETIMRAWYMGADVSWWGFITTRVWL
jgi:hypothetical protein